MKPRVLILVASGTNRDRDAAVACEAAGGDPEVVHINQVRAGARRLSDYQMLLLPGGFSYGDNLGAGRVLATDLLYSLGGRTLGAALTHGLGDDLSSFAASGKPILGICNGFQVLLKSGVLLPDDPVTGPPATLTWNSSGKFEDRWVRLVTDASHCVFLQGIERMYLPVAHAGGRFVVPDPTRLTQLKNQQQLAVRYCDEQAGVQDTVLPFPVNPSGSLANVAGVCDETGRVLGMMPHPERYIDPTQHPRWTRGEYRDPGDGLAIFANAVRYFTA